MARTGDDDDPFEGIVFDDDFVASARTREPSSQERAEAAALRARQEAATRRARGGWRRRLRATTAGAWGRLPGSGKAGLGVAAVLGLAWLGSSGLLGQPGSGWVSGDPVLGGVATGERPTATPSPGPDGRGVPIAVPDGGGDHVFIARQAGRDEPVAYDPCRPIRVVVNERTMPDGAEQMVDGALAEVSRVTGLRFQVEGLTDEQPVGQRKPFQPERYGDRWAPVLVAWTDPDEVPELDGSVIGIGGSTSALAFGERPTQVFVSGVVALDGPSMAEVLTRDNGYRSASAVVLHELGHVVGLDHSSDQGQLMHGEGSADVVDYQSGDIEGLVRLGDGPCVESL